MKCELSEDKKKEIKEKRRQLNKKLREEEKASETNTLLEMSRANPHKKG